MKLPAMAFANAFASTAATMYIIYYLISLLAPNFFAFVFNSTFFGADLISLYPKEVGWLAASEYVSVIAVAAWVFGYMFAWTYNYLIAEGAKARVKTEAKPEVKQETTTA